MNKQAALYKTICESNYSLADIASKMNISVIELEEKIDSMDLLATEMQQLTNILSIKNPYKFFY